MTKRKKHRKRFCVTRQKNINHPDVVVLCCVFQIHFHFLTKSLAMFYIVSLEKAATQSCAGGAGGCVTFSACGGGLCNEELGKFSDVKFFNLNNFITVATFFLLQSPACHSTIHSLSHFCFTLIHDSVCYGLTFVSTITVHSFDARIQCMAVYLLF